MKLTEKQIAEFVKAKVLASALRSAGYSASDLEEFMKANRIMQITHCRTPMTFGDVELSQSYSAVLVGGRWLHGVTIADILEQI